MDFIFNWLMDKSIGAFTGCFKLISLITLDSFENPVVKALFTSIKMVGYPLLGLSILAMLLKMMIALVDKKEVEFGNTLQRVIIAAAVYQFGVEIMKNLYLVILEIGNKVIGAISELDVSDIESLMDEEYVVITSILGLVMIVIALFYLIKTFLDLLERFWMFFLSLIMVYFYIPGYIMGNEESLVLWFKQTLGIGLTQLFQVLIMSIAIALFCSTKNENGFLLAIGAIIATSRVEQILDKWGQSAGGKYGNFARNAMSSMYYFKMLKR